MVVFGRKNVLVYFMEFVLVIKLIILIIQNNFIWIITQFTNERILKEEFEVLNNLVFSLRVELDK